MQEFTASEAYVQCPQPMPVGSTIVLCVAEDLEIPVQVAHVSEQVAGAERPAGMFVGAYGLEGAALAWWQSNMGAAADSAEDSEAPDTEVMPAVTPEEVAAAKEAKKAEPAEETSAKPAKGKKKRRRRRNTRNK